MPVSVVERFGVATEVSPRAVARVILGLFQGLMRQHRLDPAAVPDDLLTQALRWLVGGMRLGATTDPGRFTEAGADVTAETDDDC